MVLYYFGPAGSRGNNLSTTKQLNIFSLFFNSKRGRNLSAPTSVLKINYLWQLKCECDPRPILPRLCLRLKILQKILLCLNCRHKKLNFHSYLTIMNNACFTCDSFQDIAHSSTLENRELERLKFPPHFVIKNAIQEVIAS